MFQLYFCCSYFFLFICLFSFSQLLYALNDNGRATLSAFFCRLLASPLELPSWTEKPVSLALQLARRSQTVTTRKLQRCPFRCSWGFISPFFRCVYRFLLFFFFFFFIGNTIYRLSHLLFSRASVLRLMSSLSFLPFWRVARATQFPRGIAIAAKKKKGKGNERECGMEEKKNPMRRSPLQALTDRKDAEGQLFLVYLCCRTVFLCALLRLFFFFSPSSFLFRFPWQLVFCFLLRVRARAFVFSGVKCGWHALTRKKKK